MNYKRNTTHRARDGYFFEKNLIKQTSSLRLILFD